MDNNKRKRTEPEESLSDLSSSPAVKRPVSKKTKAGLPSFYSAREGIESGAPFKLNSTDFVLSDFNEKEKIRIRDALMHDTYLSVTIKSIEELYFYGDLLRLHKKLQNLVLQFKFKKQLETDDNITFQAAIANFGENLKQSNVSDMFLSRSVRTTPNLCNVFDALRQMTSLTHLVISVNLLPVEEMSFAEILSNERLEEMEFGRPAARKPGTIFKDTTWLRKAELLSRHPTLKAIKWELLTPAAYASLGSALKTNTALKKVCLWNSVVQPENMRHICEGLKQNSTLHEMDILRYSVPDESIQIFFESFANDAIKIQKVNLMLVRLRMGCISVLSESLKANTVLKKLILTGTDLNGDTCQELCHGLNHNKGLKKLILSDNDLGLIGVKEISALLKENTPLEYLDLLRCWKGDDENFRILSEGLKHNRTLKTLLIPRNEISSKGCAYICDALKTNRTLNSLNMNFNPTIGDEGLISIRNMIIENTTLRELDIGDCYQTLDDLAQICEAFKINQSLTSLTAYKKGKVNYDYFQEKIVEALQDNYALTKFQNNFRTDKIRELIARNIKMKSEIAYKVAVISRNIARSKEAMALLPREIWIWIMKQIRHPGIVSFDNTIDKAFGIV